jgi:hypothetical protein
VDPMAEKFQSESPYAYVNNDPLGFSDFDGKDYLIDITRDKKGNITGVRISGTVYIQGEGASKSRAGELNDFSTKNLKPKTVNGITIGVSLTYKFDESKTEKNLKGGENILSFNSAPENDENVSHVNAMESRYGDGPVKHLAGKTGTIFDKGKDNNTVFHESLHLLGLSDRYEDYRGNHNYLKEYQTTYPHKGYENNVMGNSSSTNLNKDQYKAWMEHAVSRSKVNNNTNRIWGLMTVDRNLITKP